MHGETNETLSPVQQIGLWGAELSGGQLTLDDALTRLAATVMTLPGFQTSLIQEEVERLSVAEGNVIVQPGDEVFTNLVRLTTKGIAFLVPTDEPVELPQDTSITSLIGNTTEGVTWVDPTEKLKREELITRNSNLLRAFADGLVSEKVPVFTVKRIMRAELKAIIDDVSSRSSYAAIYATKVLTTIMKEAGLSNLQTRLSWLRHNRDTIRAFGVNIYRLAE